MNYITHHLSNTIMKLTMKTDFLMFFVVSFVLFTIQVEGSGRGLGVLKPVQPLCTGPGCCSTPHCVLFKDTTTTLLEPPLPQCTGSGCCSTPHCLLSKDKKDTATALPKPPHPQCTGSSCCSTPHCLRSENTTTRIPLPTP